VKAFLKMKLDLLWINSSCIARVIILFIVILVLILSLDQQYTINAFKMKYYSFKIIKIFCLNSVNNMPFLFRSQIRSEFQLQNN